MKTPSGVILLKNCTLSKDKKLKGLFLISGPHLKRTYELQAANDQEADAWINAINTLIHGKGKLTEKEVKEEKQELQSKTETVEIEGMKVKQKKVTLEDFDFLCVLGRGSFGKVMKVRKRDTKEIYAMKILSKEMLLKQNMINYTKQENAILQGVDHPFIVGLRFAFQTDSKLYLVMDFLSGGELFFHLSKEVKFSVDRTRFYAAELVLALGHLHSKDIVYRDLKPENVVLDSEGHTVMTDFGLAKKDVTNNNPTSTFCGISKTLLYDYPNSLNYPFCFLIIF